VTESTPLPKMYSTGPRAIYCINKHVNNISLKLNIDITVD